MISEREEYFNSLVRDYSERLYRHVRSIVGSHEDADDLMQDIYIKVWHSLSSFRGESSAFTWLWRIATNMALNHLRAQSIRQRFAFSAKQDAGTVSTSDTLEGDEIERRFSKALSSLPPKQRAVFCMRYFEELSYEEIAAVTGTSEGALKASYHIAQNKDKQIVTDFF